MSICGHPVDDNSIAHVYDAVEIGGCFRVVGDHHDGLAKIFVQLPEHPEDDLRAFRIQIPRGRNDEKNLRLPDQSEAYVNASQLAPGKTERFLLRAPCR